MRAFNADADIAGNCLQEIVKAYSGKSRYYHNLDHIAALLRMSASNEVINLAIFYHDIVYKVPALDNEHKSAFLAAERLPLLAVPAAVVRSNEASPKKLSL